MLENLLTCRNLLNDEIFNNANKFENAAKLIEYAENLGLSGNILRSYLIYKLANEPNLVSETVESSGGKIGESLYNAFKHDIEILSEILNGEIAADDSEIEAAVEQGLKIWAEHLKIVNPAEYEKFFGGKIELLQDYKPTVTNKFESFCELQEKLSNLRDAAEIAKIFIEHYKKYGYGDIAAYRAFKWDSEDKKIVGIKHFETIRLEDLIGYANQKDLLTKNTRAFLENKPANNVLLVGARGTGKSSGVKALVNEYYSQGLRLVQITKPQLKQLPEIMETLRNFASRRFIIFLDDLSFEESETEYKYLKSSIEGGVESRPENVLIYATSNRRHLIRETWRDRVDTQEDLYRDDSLNETISLSDRFGLIIHYYAPTQAEYLEIIRHMLKKKNIALDDETLRIEGLRWEMSHSGRNGRTAQQFVNFYLGQL